MTSTEEQPVIFEQKQDLIDSAIEAKDNDIEENSHTEKDPLLLEIECILNKPTKLMRKVIHIHGKIYLGGRKEVLDIPQLKELGITHILNCAEDVNENFGTDGNDFWLNFFGDQFEYRGLCKAVDSETYDMIGNHWTTDCEPFLSSSLSSVSNNNNNNQHKVLIACRGATNRSCTIIACALMYFYEMTCIQSISAIHSKKWPVLTNQYFVQQLIQFEKEMKTKKEHKKS